MFPPSASCWNGLVPSSRLKALKIDAATLLSDPDERLPHAGGRSSARVVVLADSAALAEHLAAWDDLAARAVESNAFYESWMLLPAIHAFGQASALQFVLVYLPDPQAPLNGRDPPPVLAGFFPLERMTRYRGFPLPHLRMWLHRHCFLGAPLLRAGTATECLSAFLAWLKTEPGGALAMDWGRVPAEGLFHQALGHALDAARLPRFRQQDYSRGMLRRRADAEAYLEAALPRKSSRRELGRLERRLGEQGELRYVECGPGDDVERWIQQFLAVEGSGWKGRQGSALASTEANRSFFIRAAREGARRGQLQMLGLYLDGKPVAMKCNFLGAGRRGEGAFTFKIGFDEAYARYSPGTLLEVENIRRFHARRELQWMDSCAAPEHFMINRLWLDRRAIQHLLVSSGRAAGDCIVRALPLARWLHRRIIRPVFSLGRGKGPARE